jgi:hypothetical protein
MKRAPGFLTSFEFSGSSFETQSQTNPLRLIHLMTIGCVRKGANKPKKAIAIIISGLRRFWVRLSRNMNDVILSIANFKGRDIGLSCCK